MLECVSKVGFWVAPLWCALHCHLPWNGWRLLQTLLLYDCYYEAPMVWSFDSMHQWLWHVSENWTSQEICCKTFSACLLNKEWRAYAQREWDSGVPAARMPCTCAAMFYSMKENMIWIYVVVCREDGPRMWGSGSVHTKHFSTAELWSAGLMKTDIWGTFIWNSVKLIPDYTISYPR